MTVTNDSLVVERSRRRSVNRKPRSIGGISLVALNTLVCLFLLAPILVVVVTSFSRDQFMRFPPSGWSFRWYETFLTDDKLLSAFGLSVGLGIATAAIATVVGTLAAIALDRNRSNWAGTIQTMHSTPILIPGVVTGLAMLIFFTAIGLNGSFLVLLFGHIVLTIPFIVIIVLSGLKSFDRSIEEAAISVGASRTVAFLTVTIPVIKTSVLSAAAFAFLYSLDEVVVTLFLPGLRTTRTLPVVLFDYVQFNLDPLPAAISVVLIAIALAIVIVAARMGAATQLMDRK